LEMGRTLFQKSASALSIVFAVVDTPTDRLDLLSGLGVDGMAFRKQTELLLQCPNREWSVAENSVGQFACEALKLCGRNEMVEDSGFESIRGVDWRACEKHLLGLVESEHVDEMDHPRGIVRNSYPCGGYSKASALTPD